MLIDYQPPQFSAVRSIDPDLLLENIVSTVETAKAFDLPTVQTAFCYLSRQGWRRNEPANRWSPGRAATPVERLALLAGKGITPDVCTSELLAPQS